MKTITSKKKLLAAMKKHHLHTNGVQWYLSDFHHHPVGRVIANKVISEGLVESTYRPSWFETAYRLKINS